MSRSVLCDRVKGIDAESYCFGLIKQQMEAIVVDHVNQLVSRCAYETFPSVRKLSKLNEQTDVFWTFEQTRQSLTDSLSRQLVLARWVRSKRLKQYGDRIVTIRIHQALRQNQNQTGGDADVDFDTDIIDVDTSQFSMRNAVQSAINFDAVTNTIQSFKDVVSELMTTNNPFVDIQNSYRKLVEYNAILIETFQKLADTTVKVMSDPVGTYIGGYLTETESLWNEQSWFPISVLFASLAIYFIAITKYNNSREAPSLPVVTYKQEEDDKSRFIVKPSVLDVVAPGLYIAKTLWNIPVQVAMTVFYVFSIENEAPDALIASGLSNLALRYVHYLYLGETRKRAALWSVLTSQHAQIAAAFVCLGVFGMMNRRSRGNLKREIETLKLENRHKDEQINQLKALLEIQTALKREERLEMQSSVTDMPSLDPDILYPSALYGPEKNLSMSISVSSSLASSRADDTLALFIILASASSMTITS